MQSGVTSSFREFNSADGYASYIVSNISLFIAAANPKTDMPKSVDSSTLAFFVKIFNHFNVSIANC